MNEIKVGNVTLQKSSISNKMLVYYNWQYVAQIYEGKLYVHSNVELEDSIQREIEEVGRNFLLISE